MVLSLNPRAWMPAWPDLTSVSLLPSGMLTSVWNIYWEWKGIWSQTQVQTATRTCHVAGTKQDHIASLKPTKWPQLSWERKKTMWLMGEQWKGLGYLFIVLPFIWSQRSLMWKIEAISGGENTYLMDSIIRRASWDTLATVVLTNKFKGHIEPGRKCIFI